MKIFLLEVMGMITLLTSCINPYDDMSYILIEGHSYNVIQGFKESVVMHDPGCALCKEEMAREMINPYNGSF